MDKLMSVCVKEIQSSDFMHFFVYCVISLVKFCDSLHNAVIKIKILAICQLRY